MATKPGKTVNQTVEVTLNYGYAVYAPKFQKVKEGDKLTFTCPQGKLDLVLFPKNACNKNTFKTGDAPILVKKSGPVKIWCGGRFDVPKTIVPTRGAYVTIKPARGKFGVHSEDGP